MRMIGNITWILGGAFILSLTLSAQTFTTLYNFGSQSYDGAYPQSGLILGPEGELYGTASEGGRWGAGTVYELSPPVSSGGAWTEVVLHSFNLGNAQGPTAGLAMGPNGSLYGIAGQGTSGAMAFRLDPPTGTSTHWPYSVIYRFALDDSIPSGGLVFGSPLGYGQSLYGNTGQNGAEQGSVYRLTPPPAAGGAWTHTTLYSFPGGSRGTFPTGRLAVGSAGTLFGVTSDGGYVGGGCAYFDGCGTVFSLAPPAQAGGLWTEGVLHAFNPGIDDGAMPEAGLIIGPGGVLYGTTAAGPGDVGAGIAFSLTPPLAPGAPMTETVLHAFTGAGGFPNVLLLGPNGVLYGTTFGLNGTGNGTVFELTPPASPGGSWTETILHSFTNSADGLFPNGLILAPDGTLYGTTELGGTNGYGTVFALTP